MTRRAVSRPEKVGREGQTLFLARTGKNRRRFPGRTRQQAAGEERPSVQGYKVTFPLQLVFFLYLFFVPAYSAGGVT